MRDSRQAADRLMGWYDAHARDLPWRVPPGAAARPDPYRVWLSEVMLQQTTVAAVREYFHRFTRIWPDVHALAAAEDPDVMAAWAGLGYYARARNLLACARVVSRDLDGTFPDTEDGLRALPGIGPYTAAAIAAIAFDRPAVVVDGNVERVMARLFAIRTPLPAAKPAIRDAAAALTPERRPGDHAQAVMDLGATICTAKSPSCLLCPLKPDCAGHAAGIAATLPAKAPKKAKPTRRGYVYLARRGSDWLTERRPDKGLLGGMAAFPTSDWSEAPAEAPPFDAPWRDAGEVRHTFTHFHLILTVRVAEATGNPDRGQWTPLDPAALPTLFRKAHALAVT
ncbi:A/G-specific adenine glycosylase [Jannaschia aquimarina]|uniref:Adenine DNA glycosylase n=1 Tax=Jannaschia aquimarina TaxID=935700 RepID=A0A0D1EIE2_9RHOB|nr:A/G-specific adenine glycosylase [Jannaschia aquimarina]KIT16686.1 putative A/G-specific adenine glycosylase YfhQ [Jannaschia aquimarina]SNS55106.1 A/G-specific DNA-adenine glycosylase [Jannaschia aquimarina]